MKRYIKKLNRFFSPRSGYEIDPDEVLMDAQNIPNFNKDQFEGRLIKPISFSSIVIIGGLFFLVVLLFSGKIYNLQIVNGEANRDISENNRLRHTPLFAERGAVFDRNGKELIWNVKMDDPTIWERKYTELEGMAHILGYVKYPTKDSSGFYYREDYEGMDGIEKLWNDRIRGKNGLTIVETNALGKVVSSNTIQPAVSGENITLSVDAEISNTMYKKMKELAERLDFKAGAGVIMDVRTGEIISLVSYPEYSSQVLTDGKDSTLINKYLTDSSRPFLNKVVDGAYTPGSIVKIFMSLAALSEKVIDPSTKILSTGSIKVPNEYNPGMSTVFNDWKAHGWVDMRHALAVSSNVYFYEMGGGFKDQKGLGIANIKKYFDMFGFGKAIDTPFFNGVSGVIPTPEWKAKNFNGEIWRVGDTYHTAIGQYGFQVSPIQVVRAVASVANGGKLLVPSFTKNAVPNVESEINIPESSFQIVREGMRLAVKEGTAKPLDVSYVNIGGKSGTAEVGLVKARVNSWIVGFFPYEDPKYAFTLIMEKGPRTNTLGAGYIMKEIFDWIKVYKPEYLK